MMVVSGLTWADWEYAAQDVRNIIIKTYNLNKYIALLFSYTYIPRTVIYVNFMKKQML